MIFKKLKILMIKGQHILRINANSNLFEKFVFTLYRIINNNYFFNLYKGEKQYTENPFKLNSAMVKQKYKFILIEHRIIIKSRDFKYFCILFKKPIKTGDLKFKHFK